GKTPEAASPRWPLVRGSAVSAGEPRPVRKDRSSAWRGAGATTSRLKACELRSKRPREPEREPVAQAQTVGLAGFRTMTQARSPDGRRACHEVPVWRRSDSN